MVPEQDRRIRIITGYYGSGKTEFSINYAFALRKALKKTALADLDIVNVYFRSRECRIILEKAGIRLISSSLSGNAVDLPAIPAEVFTPLQDSSYEYVIDLGGNDAGTKVLGLLRPYLKKEEIDFFMIVNTCRPETCDTEKIIHLMKKLERFSGLRVTGLIHNTNLIDETEEEILLHGETILSNVSLCTGVPIRYVTYEENKIKQLPQNLSGERFPLTLFMRELWM